MSLSIRDLNLPSSRPNKWFAQMTEHVRREAGLSQQDLFYLYRFAGGETKLSAFLHHLQGKSEPGITEAALISDILNDELERQGKPPMMPDFGPVPRGSGTDNSADGDGQWVARDLNPEPTDIASVVPITRKSAKKSRPLQPVEQHLSAPLASLS